MLMSVILLLLIVMVFFHKAIGNTIGVVTGTEVPFGCLDIIDEADYESG